MLRELSRESGEVEVKGLAQKKNKTGFFQYRYFATASYNLYYWNTQHDYEKHAEPSSSYDIREIKDIDFDRQKRLLCLQFSNKKFRLELKVASEEEVIDKYTFVTNM